MANIVGTNGNDLINEFSPPPRESTLGADFIKALGANDTVAGLAGNDTLSGLNSEGSIGGAP